MKIFRPVLAFLCLLLATLPAAAAVLPSIDLEEKIARQQGQFGGLYAHCGSGEEKAVIGGSLDVWRTETFRGYQGGAANQARLEKAFNEAAQAVAADPASCQDWIKEASVTWRSIVQLATYGGPVKAALN